MHKRQEIRDAIVTLLKGKTGAGQNVLAARVDPYTIENIPMISVYSNNEKSEVHSLYTWETKRTLEITIEAVFPGETCAALLDDACAIIESNILANKTWAGKARDSKLTQTEFVFTPEGQKSVGLAKLTYEVEYLNNV